MPGNFPRVQRFDLLRKHDPEDVERKRQREHEPRRKAKQKLAKALRSVSSPAPSPESHPISLTARVQLAAYQKEKRCASTLPPPTAQELKVLNYGRHMERKNQFLNFNGEGLKVQCNLKILLGRLFEMKCHYCGEDGKNHGLDKIDCMSPYTLRNILPCCKTCNFSKHLLGYDVFIEQCKKITLHQSQEEDVCAYCGGDGGDFPPRRGPRRTHARRTEMLTTKFRVVQLAIS